jgi:GTPase Era involved in 16S rRNA processing
MTRTIEFGNSTEAIQQLVGLYERFKENQDIQRADKSVKLLKKLYFQDFIIAFCGHFSAGKSTMINALLGENILPSSPIPTSANLVKIHKSSSDFAKVYYKDEDPYLFEAPYNFSTVKEFCKNGNVTEIEIGKRETDLPDGITIMDTPGVDSTDDAHRISTESEIHLADIVFYVMDYNHVQSELNFLYTKELLHHGVELYLIINQIDKHKEEEISFADFKQSVQESFSSWNVHPRGIFYTTLKGESEVNNQFEEVKSLVQDVLKQKEQRLASSIQSAANLLIQEHFKWLREQEEEEAQSYEESLSHVSNDKDSILRQEQDLISKIKNLKEIVEIWKRTFDEERTKILKNAYLMPYQTREISEKYLTSLQPDFKIGLWFGKKKTEEERATRLDVFYKNMQEQVDSQLIWHIRQLAAKVLKDANISNEELQSAAGQLSVHFESSLLKECVKTGAGLSGEYVLHYCEEIADRLKKLAFQELEQFKQKVTEQFTRDIQKEISIIETELDSIKYLADSIRMVQKLSSIRNEKEVNVFKPISYYKENYQSLQSDWHHERTNYRIYTNDRSSLMDVKEIKMEHIKTAAQPQDEELYSIEKTLDRLNHTAELLKNKAGFQRITDHLMEKKSRLKNRQFTIALFGAFSAGKSSFANALLGEKVLPVSPNPTTAAINRICPPTTENHHGTAVVHLKSKSELLADVQKSLKAFNEKCESLEQAEAHILKIIRDQNQEGQEEIHLSFLRAFLKGFPHFKDKLGENVLTDLKEFRGFVSNESQSCLVESIDLYYDCEITRQGITLVDTPGADSINARHTGIAFEYIKNSDAILFVTYYNHAFSKADREFLIQLGRVKDAFELDKMFFIVNAIDLADSKEELNEVLTYVNDQLTQYGIRFPKLFGVSSLLALQKQEKTSGIDEFQAAFSSFLSKDLMKMTIQSANNEIQRALKMVDHYIETALEGQEEKDRRKKQLFEIQEQIEELLIPAKSAIIISKMKQEQKELLFYVKQRVFYRFTDFFKESFNPTTLQNNNKSALFKALEELLDSLGYDFAQEMRATSLRLENYIKGLFLQRFEQFQVQISNLQATISISEFEINGILTPYFDSAFIDIDKNPLEKTFKYFRNSKAFFEKNEKQLMEDEIQLLLRPLADGYLEKQNMIIENHFIPYIETEFTKMVDHIKADVHEQFNALVSVLNENVNINEWTTIRQEIANDSL